MAKRRPHVGCEPVPLFAFRQELERSAVRFDCVLEPPKVVEPLAAVDRRPAPARPVADPPGDPGRQVGEDQRPGVVAGVRYDVAAAEE